MKLRSALLLVVAATLCALSGLLMPQEAAASIDVVNQWPTLPTIASNSAAGTVTGKFTPGIGNNRLMLVAVSTRYSAAGTAGISASYGGQALTQIITTGSFVNGLWIGYLKEAGVATGASGTKILSVTNSNVTNLTNMNAYVAVFNGVDQGSTPVTGSAQNATASAASLALTLPLTSNQGLTGNAGLAVYVTNWFNQTNTPSSGYTEIRDYTGTNINFSANYKVITGTANESITAAPAAATAGAAVAVSLNPALRVATNTTCGDCHGNPPQDTTVALGRNVPPGQFVGAHEKHAGGNYNQYTYVCTECHYNAVGYNHSTGFKNISGTRVPRNTYGTSTNYATTNNPSFQTCTKSTCHSSGRSNIQYSASPVWNTTSTCLSCHGGRNSGTNAYSRSASNFSMSTTHGQHLGKYTSTEINCQMCHGKTAQNHTALKNYTGTNYHANGNKTVYFTDIAYGSYTSYKTSAGANQYKCTNTACHGGISRSKWSNTTENGGVNSDHTCAHCHGTAGTTTAQGNADRRLFAPGYRKTGTSTDQIKSSADIRVGSHFKHLSSVYMTSLKCNECHQVPSKPFDSATNHTLNNPRYNSGTLTFSQASSATIVIGVAPGSTPARNAAVSYVNGTALAAATCNTVYCHGNRLKGNDTTGSYRSPYWNYSAMINYSDKVNACGSCHGNPPRHGNYSSLHIGQTSTTSCSGCHSATVDALGNIKDKSKHINGILEATGGHEYSFAGSKHKPGGTGSLTVTSISDFSKCTGCHNQTTGGTYPVAQRKLASSLVCTVCHINNPNFFTTGSKGTCGDCHGSNTAGYYSTGQPDGNVFPNISGSHSAHIAQSYVCADCHNGRGTGVKTHGNYSGIKKTTYMNISVAFNTAKAGTAAKWNNGAGTLANTSCTTSVCHGQKSPAWGAPVPAQQCRRCHGSQSLAYANFSSPEIAPGTGNIDTNRTSGVTARGGVHQEHLNASSSMSEKVKCNNCHGNVTTKAVNHAQLDNRTTATIAFNGNAVAASHSPTVSRVSGITNCANVYCHHGARAEGTAAGQSGFASRAALTWNNSGLITGTTVANTCTNICHQMPPGGGVASDAHVSLTANGTYTTPASLQACNGCHPTINATIPDMASIFANKLKHIDGTVDGGSCSGCHGYEVGTWAAKAERIPALNQGKGAHEKHIAYLVSLWGGTLNASGDQFGTGASWTNVCGVCHNGATHNTGEASGGTGRTISIPATWQFGPSAPVYNAAGTIGTSSATSPKTCSNISCHYLTTPIWSTY